MILADAAAELAASPVTWAMVALTTVTTVGGLGTMIVGWLNNREAKRYDTRIVSLEATAKEVPALKQGIEACEKKHEQCEEKHEQCEDGRAADRIAFDKKVDGLRRELESKEKELKAHDVKDREELQKQIDQQRQQIAALTHQTSGSGLKERLREVGVEPGTDEHKPV